ncbi:MAG: RHS repeat domain-containing protein [Pyrinomonadaceae bacterium]
MVYYSADGTYMRLEIPDGQTGRNPATWTLYMPDGSKVESTSTVANKIYDRNGNYVTKGTVTLPDSTTAEAYIDQVGRYVAKKTISPTEDRFYRLGVNGALIMWTVKWKYITVIRKYTTSGASSGQYRGGTSSQNLVSEQRVVDEILMPSQLGGLKFTFTYDAHNGQVTYDPNNPNYSSGWGEINDVTLPSGAKAEYDYDLEGLSSSETGLFNTMLLLPRLGKVKTKRLKYDSNYDGLITPETDTWSYTITQTGTSTTTAPNGSTTTLNFYRTDTDNDFSGRVYKATAPDGTITESLWKNNQPGGFTFGGIRRLNTYVKTKFTTLPDANGNPSLTAITDFEYDKNGNITKITEYEFIPYSTIPRDSLGIVTGIPSGAVKKKVTDKTYYNPTPPADNTASSDPNSYWLTTAKNITGAVQYTTVKTPTGVPVAHTEVIYDNPATTANPTDVRGWDSSKGAFSQSLHSGNWNRTVTTFDSYGNPTLITNANGVNTKYTYGAVGGHSGLYPTQIETADGTAVKRTTATQYDFSTGVPILVTDIDNGVSTSTEYDPLGRPVKTKSAVGTSSEAWTQVEYNDAARRVITKSDLNTVGDAKLVTIKHYDQLGRIRLARSLENAATQDPYNETQGIKVQTRYKTANPYTYAVTSNPYRAAYSYSSGSEPEMGWTRNVNWNTGRRSETETFSGAALPAPWGGNAATTGKVITEIDAEATTVTDQAGKQRRSITNALGQLIRVDEPDVNGNLGAKTSPAQPTLYSYDVLGNLTSVNQGVQTRTFAYSSLSRLMTANNPESGNIQYSYDSNGNLISKTDARNITTSYSYDPQNRVVSRAYNDGTPTVTYTYDNLPNSKGLLTKVSSAISTTEYTSFDIMGRVLTHQQITDGATFNSSYTYNLSGALIEETYPSGRKVQNTLDNEGRLAQVQTKSAYGAYETRADSFIYTSAGAAGSIRLGNNRFESTQFNSRLQPTRIALGTSANATNLLKLDFNYGTTNNNGNVLSQTITTPAGGGSAGFTAVQTYSYDSLNRIQDATETVGGAQTWRQTFSFDRYGNRNFAAGTTTIAGCPNNICNPTVDPANNKFSSGQGYSYDLSGNIVADAQGRTFFYDAENKQKEVRNSSNVIIGQYFFDGDGKRVKKVTASETRMFVYNAGGKLVSEYSTLTPNGSPVTRYLTSDHLGSPRVLTDQSGNVLSRRDFLPFGEEAMIGTGPRAVGQGYTYGDSTRQKFTTYERDNETELDFAQARMYSSRLGRFSSPDPIFISAKQAVNPQIWNLYSYAANSPLNSTDPTGMTIIQLGRSDEDIDSDITNVNKQLKAKGLSKDEKNTLNVRKSELALEKKANAWAREQIKVMENLGVANGIKVSDYSISTDPKKDFGVGSDFATTNKLTDEQAIQNGDWASTRGMFVTKGSNQIFINTSSPLANDLFNLFNPDDPDPDGQIYGASIVEHERFHRNDKVYDSNREKRAYEYQKKLLEKWGPLMQDPKRGKAFIQVIDDELTKLKGGN